MFTYRQTRGDIVMFIDLVKAFAVGGAFCAVAQILIDKTGFTPARIMVAYVTIGVVLTALGVYERIVEFSGCGATLPITGFGYSLASGVKKAVDERGIIGVLTGGFTAAAGGISASIIFGYLFSIVFKSKPKR